MRIARGESGDAMHRVWGSLVHRFALVALFVLPTTSVAQVFPANDNSFAPTVSADGTNTCESAELTATISPFYDA